MSPAPSVDPPLDAGTLRRGLLVGALLVASGAAALAHEAAWQRLWAPVAGAGVATASAVVAGTLLGLALGAALGGPWADRSRRPGLVFAAAEALGALLCAAVPLAVLAADAVQRSLLKGGVPAGRLEVAMPVLAAIVSALASLPLGASIPAAVRAFSPSRGAAGPALARLYAANTLGAVLGVFASTGLSFEAVGTLGTVLLASGVQAAVALLAAALFRGASAAVEPERAAAPAERPPSATGRLSAAAFLAGAAGLAVEIAWMRRLTPALGTTAYAFGTVLGAFLLAVALGSFFLRPRRASDPKGRPAALLFLAALPVALLVPAVAPVASWASDRLASALAEGTAGAFTLLWIRAAAAAAILVPSALLGAAALPWLLQAADPEPSSAGRGAGRLLAWNAAGSALSAVATGFLWIPAAGTAGVLRGAATLYVVAAAFAARGAKARAILCVVALAAGGLAAAPIPDPEGIGAVGATFAPATYDPLRALPLFSREGRVSTVVVRDRDGRAEFWVDGKVVASAQPTDRLHLALLGHLPMFLHQNPKRAAVVGLGTGITSTAVAAHEPDALDVFELEPAVLSAAEYFRGAGGGLPKAARFRAIDGRRGLLEAEAPYDVITTDPIHPAAAGSAALYTLEHYRLLSDRLAEGGLACQWLPLYELEPDDLRMVFRTFSRVFDVWAFVAGPDLVLVGAKKPIAVDGPALERRIASPAGDGLASLGLRSAGKLLGLLIADPERSRRFAGEGDLNTDDRPLLEFSSARSQYTGVPAWNLRLLELASADPKDLLAAPPAHPAAFSAGVKRTARLRRALSSWMAGDSDSLVHARDAFRLLAVEDPADRLSATLGDDSAIGLARRLSEEDRAEEALEALHVALQSSRLDAVQRLDAAQVYLDLGRRDEARDLAKGVLTERPDSERAARLSAP